MKKKAFEEVNPWKLAIGLIVVAAVLILAIYFLTTKYPEQVRNIFGFVNCSTRNGNCVPTGQKCSSDTEQDVGRLGCGKDLHCCIKAPWADLDKE